MLQVLRRKVGKAFDWMTELVVGPVDQEGAGEESDWERQVKSAALMLEQCGERRTVAIVYGEGITREAEGRVWSRNLT